MTRLLIVEDHAIVRAGLKKLLVSLPDADIREAADGDAALAALRVKGFDLVILDLNLPGLSGVPLLRALRDADPRLRILVLTMHSDPLHAARALEAGASGFVSKNATPEELLTAAQRVIAGQRYVEAEVAQAMALRHEGDANPLKLLTERDVEILRLLARGQSLQQIADTLNVAYKTVANGCTAIKMKLGVSRTADLVRLSIELNM